MTGQGLEAVLLDIEGTTTSISFVYDELFPFARRQLQTFLEENWDEEKTQTALTALWEQSRIDEQEGRNVPAIADTSRASLPDVVANVLLQMDDDRKTTGLKQLQGLIWKRGYETGELQGHVFEDVPQAFQRWREEGVRIAIYSSGSIAAQKLLFGSSVAGNLLPFIEAHFDTTTGPKKEATSYEKIAGSLGLQPSHILFATDNLAEAEAADQAGMKVLVMDRPGNPETGAHSFAVAQNFSSVMST